VADVNYISKEGDTVDLVCYRHYGYTAVITETVLAANPGLAALGPILPTGTEFTLPDLESPIDNPAEKEGVVQLWD